MKKLFIHVGLPKTASTFLQTKVFPRVENIKYITRPFTQQNIFFNKLQYADESLYDGGKLKAELEKIKDEKLLISDELLSGKPELNFINRSIITNRLRKLFPEAEILLFIRSQEKLLNSLYNQSVKKGGYYKPENFFWIYTNKNGLKYKDGENRWDINLRYFNTTRYYVHLDYFLYYELIKMYKENFSKVHVILFEDLTSEPKVFVEHLQNIFNEKISIDQYEFNIKVNDSIDHQQIEKKRILNKFKVLSDNKYLENLFSLSLDLIQSKIDSIDSRTFISEKAYDYYSANNQQVNKLFPEIGLSRYAEQYSTRRF